MQNVSAMALGLISSSFVAVLGVGTEPGFTKRLEIEPKLAYVTGNKYRLFSFWKVQHAPFVTVYLGSISASLSCLGPVSRKLRKLFGPERPFSINLYLKTGRCTVYA